MRLDKHTFKLRFQATQEALRDPEKRLFRQRMFRLLRSNYDAYMEGSEDYTFEQLEEQLIISYKTALLYKEVHTLEEDETVIYNLVRRALLDNNYMY